MKIITENAIEYWLMGFNIATDEGVAIEVSLRYFPYSSIWTMDVICPQENFEVYGIRVCNSTNLLESYRNKIDFGIACGSENNKIEPIYLESFSERKSALMLLNKEEVKQAANGDYDNVFNGEKE